MAALTSLADRQSGCSRAFLARLTQPPHPSGFARFPNTRTVPQPDAAPADAPFVEITKRPPPPAAAAELRRRLHRRWWRRPVDQFVPAVPDGLVAMHAGPRCSAVSARAHRNPAQCHAPAPQRRHLPRAGCLRRRPMGRALPFARGFRCVVWSQPKLRARSFVLRPRLLVVCARLDECPLRREERQPGLDDHMMTTSSSPCIGPISRKSPTLRHRITAGRRVVRGVRLDSGLGSCPRPAPRHGRPHRAILSRRARRVRSSSEDEGGWWVCSP